jgi:DNA polymerase I-like protein with 3'-5' exonuclease and polymerase domains
MTADWAPATELPDLRRVGTIALDTETRDNRLAAKMGSGWPFSDGYICGVSVAYREGQQTRALYFPIRHPDSANFDPARLYDWLKDLFATDVRVVTQNGLYDFGWLRTEAGIKMPPAERLEEIGALATLVDENRFNYSLDALCAWRGLPGKDLVPLKQAAAAYGLSKRAKPRSYIWQLPACYVGPYAEADAASTLALFENLDPILDREGTRAAYRLEIDLLPMVHEMRRRGIRIDVVAAERARDHLLQKRDTVFAELSTKLGTAVAMAEIGRNKWLAEAFDKHKIQYPRTAKGNPSFTAGNTGWMPRHPHWLPQLIVKADKLNNAAVNFLQGYILDHVVRGRIHAEIHPHRSDEGGTRSLRFSYSDPPLQLMPAHDEELTTLIRGVFLPEEGEIWAKPDISQQEFRFIVHYAACHKLAGAQQAVERYRDEPNTDFHTFVAELTGLERKSAKTANFAKAFGAGVRKFAAMINQRESDARAIYDRYDRRLPFVHKLAKYCQRIAEWQGYLELYDGARRHFDDWEMLGVAWTEGAGPCTGEEAERRIRDLAHPWYGRSALRRAETHKAMNALIQGSAARHTKLWMRACWRAGIIPLLQMHDALDCSVASAEQAEHVAQLGCEAVTLEVPMRVDLKYGRNWGDAKHSWQELHRTAAIPPSAAPSSPSRSNGGAAAVMPTAALIIPIEPKESTAVEKKSDHVPLADLVGEPLVDDKICCPFHDDSTPSLHIYDDHFHCFGCGAHGDAVDWLMMIEGLDRDAALRQLKGCWPSTTSCASGNESSVEVEVRRRRALRLWRQAQPIAGTLAERYLTERRRIYLDALPDRGEASLRFHPYCPFGVGIRHPCLLALRRDIVSDEPLSIHRIALTPDGNKIERRMLGRGGVVKLWPVGPQLVIGEGIETTLAAATRVSRWGGPLRPAWSAVASGVLSSLPVIPGVERLIMLVDHDLNGAGQMAAMRCTERWTRAGRSVVRLMPRRPGADFNDLIMGAAS